MARLTRPVCAADPGGSTEAIAAVVEAAEREDAQAIAVVGTLGAGAASPRSQRAVFDALAAARRPVFWVPGPDDAPIATYLREAHNIEVVFGDLHSVHGTGALAPGDRGGAGAGGRRRRRAGRRDLGRSGRAPRGDRVAALPALGGRVPAQAPARVARARARAAVPHAPGTQGARAPRQ